MNKKIKYIFIAIFIISAMLSFYLLNKKAEGTTAVIYQNGKIIKKNKFKHGFIAIRI